MSAPWFVLGCGYTGTYLARALVGRGVDLSITRRDGEVAVELAGQLGARALRVDLAEAETLSGVIPPGAIVVCCAPPGAAPEHEIANLAAATRDARRLVYVSSTGVYAPGNGAVVDESWPIGPTTLAGAARAAAEAAVAATVAIPWIALRAAGIYGPRRGLVERIKARTYRIIGDGRSHVSRIHIADLVAAIVAAGLSPVTGAVNVADDDPAPIGDVADAVAGLLGLAPPPRVPAASVSAEVAGMLTADRRIANRRLKTELGVVLQFPSWRDGVAAELGEPR